MPCAIARSQPRLTSRNLCFQLVVDHQPKQQNSGRSSGPTGRVLLVIAGTGLVCYSFFCWYFWDRVPLTGAFQCAPVDVRLSMVTSERAHTHAICEPCVGRGRVIFVPKEYERKLGYAGFQAILQQHREHILPPNHEVRCILHINEQATT